MKNYVSNKGFHSIDNGNGTTTLFVQCNAQLTGSLAISGSIVNNGVTMSNKSGPKIIVGNSLAGDTLADCHFLDSGNGVQLQAALSSVSANLYDVWVRPGQYIPTFSLNIPSLASVRFSGFASPIRTTATNRNVLNIANDAKVFDLYVEISAPGPGATGTNLITFGSTNFIENLYVYTEYTSNLANMGNESLRFILSSSNYSGTTMVSPVIATPSFEIAGVTTNSMTALGGSGTSTSNGLNLLNFQTNNADIGLQMVGPGSVTNFQINSCRRQGVVLAANSSFQKAQQLSNGNITMAPNSEVCFGATINTGLNASGLFGAKFSNVSFTKLGAANTGSIGIRALGTGVGLQVNGCSFDAFPTVMTASATQTNVVAVGNVLRTFTNGIQVQSSGSVVANNAQV